MYCPNCRISATADARYCCRCGVCLVSVETDDAERDDVAHLARLNALGELAAGLVHELNQPLTAIQFYACAALESVPGPEQSALRDALTEINNESLRAAELIRRVRSFARRSPSTRGPCDVNHLIRDALRMVHHDLRRHRIHQALCLDDALPKIVVDGVQIQQVVLNLVRNAIESMTAADSSERLLIVITRPEVNGLRVSVSDTGQGMEPAMACKLFEPFQTTKPNGLGLGLAICRRLIEAHHGRIGIDSGSSKGTTFFFELPFADPAQSTADVRRSAA